MSEEQDNVELASWEPERHLRSVSTGDVKLSRGFLRARPERWFPSMSSQWAPLAHALGIELRLVEVKTASRMPEGVFEAYYGLIDEEPCVLRIDQSSIQNLMESIGPGAPAKTTRFVVEYAMRRLLVTLGSSWTGPQAATIRFTPDAPPCDDLGVIKLSLMLNDAPVTIWLSLGNVAVEKLDTLWRKQVQSAARQPQAGVLHIEVAQLAVPPSMLVDYLAPGAPIDLEVLVSDSATLRLGGKPWLPVRLLNINGNLGVEVIAGPVQTPTSVPEGTTRMSIEIGQFKANAPEVAELGQVGAILDTKAPLSNQVQLVINEEKVGDATLCVYEGRFAVTVS
jgi:hypothetical protein